MSEYEYPAESVYNLIPKEVIPPQKLPRYTSKFRKTVILETKANKKSMKTMGPAKLEVPSPDQYLKKHSKEPKLPENIECTREVCQTCATGKPAVPQRTDNPPMGIQTKRDFLKRTPSDPMKPVPISVDTKRGDRQRLENSGLVPKYIKKKDYGKVPEYLIQLNEEKEQKAKEEYENYMRKQREEGTLTVLSEDKRQEILEKLKKNWDEVHHDYQGLPLVTDTLSKKARKERLEAELKQLEDDIRVFERFKTIYIAKDK